MVGKTLKLRKYETDGNSIQEGPQKDLYTFDSTTSGTEFSVSYDYATDVLRVYDPATKKLYLFSENDENELSIKKPVPGTEPGQAFYHSANSGVER